MLIWTSDTRKPRDTRPINYYRVHFALRWEKWVATAALAWPSGSDLQTKCQFFILFFRPGVTSRRGIHYIDEPAMPINFNSNYHLNLSRAVMGNPRPGNSHLGAYSSCRRIHFRNELFPILTILVSRQIMSSFGVMYLCGQQIALAWFRRFFRIRAGVGELYFSY